MASIFVDEGMDVILGQWPKNATRETTSTSACSRARPRRPSSRTTAALAGVTETTYTSYARQALATATWGAQSEYSTTSAGRRRTRR
jgi:hypothetical protein